MVFGESNSSSGSQIGFISILKNSVHFFYKAGLILKLISFVDSLNLMHSFLVAIDSGVSAGGFMQDSSRSENSLMNIA